MKSPDIGVYLCLEDFPWSRSHRPTVHGRDAVEQVIVRLCCELDELVKPDRRLVSLQLAYHTADDLPMKVSLMLLSRLVVATLPG